jgi:hypothetical protein
MKGEGIVAKGVGKVGVLGARKEFERRLAKEGRNRGVGRRIGKALVERTSYARGLQGCGEDAAQG